MSITDVPVSSAARQRIRSFSVWIWLWGALILFIVALNVYAVDEDVVEDVAVEDVAVEVDDGSNRPWEVAEPTVFEPDGTTYSGSGSGLIRIPLEEHGQDPYTVALVTSGYLSLYITQAENLGQPATDRSYPAYSADVHREGDVALILPHNADLELWVESGGPWEFTLQKAEVTKIKHGFATGTGTRHLVYRGDAASAHFSHRGTGRFSVTIQTPESYPDYPISEIGDVDQRKSWDPTSAVYFTIETDELEGTWSIDIDELATDAPTRPAASALHTTASRQPRGTTPR